MLFCPQAPKKKQRGSQARSLPLDSSSFVFSGWDCVSSRAHPLSESEKEREERRAASTFFFFKEEGKGEGDHRLSNHGALFSLSLSLGCLPGMPLRGACMETECRRALSASGITIQSLSTRASMQEAARERRERERGERERESESSKIDGAMVSLSSFPRPPSLPLTPNPISSRYPPSCAHSRSVSTSR